MARGWSPAGLHRAGVQGSGRRAGRRRGRGRAGDACSRRWGRGAGRPAGPCRWPTRGARPASARCRPAGHSRSAAGWMRWARSRKDRLDEVAARLAHRQGGELRIVERTLRHDAVDGERQLSGDLLQRQRRHVAVAPAAVGQQAMGVGDGGLAALHGHVHGSGLPGCACERGKASAAVPWTRTRSRPSGKARARFSAQGLDEAGGQPGGRDGPFGLAIPGPDEDRAARRPPRYATGRMQRRRAVRVFGRAARESGSSRTGSSPSASSAKAAAAGSAVTGAPVWKRIHRAAAAPPPLRLRHPHRRCRHRPARRGSRRRRAREGRRRGQRAGRSSATVPGSAKAPIRARKTAWASKTGVGEAAFDSRVGEAAFDGNAGFGHQSSPRTMSEEVDAGRLGLLGAAATPRRRRRPVPGATTDGVDPAAPLGAHCHKRVEMRRHAGMGGIAAEHDGSGRPRRCRA